MARLYATALPEIPQFDIASRDHTGSGYLANHKTGLASLLTNQQSGLQSRPDINHTPGVSGGQFDWLEGIENKMAAMGEEFIDLLPPPLLCTHSFQTSFSCFLIKKKIGARPFKIFVQLFIGG